jgi:hypothetical protein
MKLIKQCKTCEFNFDGICAGHGKAYKYGDEITDDTKGCNDWGANEKYYTEITQNAPWYIKEDYKDCKISYDEFIKRIDEDEKGIPIKVNLYDAIEKIYGITRVELAEILNVSLGVINHARNQGTAAKRVVDFSVKLCIPVKLFTLFSTNDFKKLEKCKEEFFKQGNPRETRDKNMKWKREKLVPMVQECLNCSTKLAEKYYVITNLEWSKNIIADNYNELEIEFIDFIVRTHKNKGYDLSSFEYKIDRIGIPKLSLSYFKTT